MKLLFVKIIFFFLVFQPVFALQIPGEKYFIDINFLNFIINYPQFYQNFLKKNVYLIINITILMKRENF